jgi:hypothetical protein
LSEPTEEYTDWDMLTSNRRTVHDLVFRDSFSFRDRLRPSAYSLTLDNRHLHMLNPQPD